MKIQSENDAVAKNTETFCAMLEVMDFTLEKQADGKFYIEDWRSEYERDPDIEERFEEGSARDIVNQISYCLDDIYFNDLREEAEGELGVNSIEIDGSVKDSYWVQPTAEKWVQFMDEHESFKDEHLHEYEVMKLLSSPEDLDKVPLNDVVQYFSSKSEKMAELLAQITAYEDYKEEWIKTHVSETDMIATEAAYENDEEAKDMTFEEYVEEYGFANGMIYVCFEEFLENEYLKQQSPKPQQKPPKNTGKEITDD